MPERDQPTSGHSKAPSTPPQTSSGTPSLADAQTPPRRLNLSESLSAETLSNRRSGDRNMPGQHVRSSLNLPSGSSVRAGAEIASKSNLSGFVVQPGASDEGNGGGEQSNSSREKYCGNDEFCSLVEDVKKQMTSHFHQNRDDMDRLLTIVQQESAKRTALEQRFHSQLLLQSEAMVAMELKLLRLEAKMEGKDTDVQLQHAPIRGFRSSMASTPRSEHNNERRQRDTAEGMAVITSGASLASGVTYNDDRSVEVHSGEDDQGIVQANDTDSTPTFGSRQPPRFTVGNLDSILLNPMLGETPGHLSTRAVRGDLDTNSSLATRSTATGSTFASTVITSATRGTEGIQVRPLNAEEVRSFRDRSQEPRAPRSRSHSPLTAQDNTTVGSGEGPSVASASVGTSILSNLAVQSGRLRRVSTADSARPLDNRVVSFTPEITEVHNLGQVYEGAADSITMPDELDNLSEVAESLVTSVRLWREEYEARLDALQKRWASE